MSCPPWWSNTPKNGGESQADFVTFCCCCFSGVFFSLNLSSEACKYLVRERRLPPKLILHVLHNLRKRERESERDENKITKPMMDVHADMKCWQRWHLSQNWWHQNWACRVFDFRCWPGVTGCGDNGEGAVVCATRCRHFMKSKWFFFTCNVYRNSSLLKTITF